MKKSVGRADFCAGIYERRGPQTRPYLDSSSPEAQLPAYDLRAYATGFLLYRLAPLREPAVDTRALSAIAFRPEALDSWSGAFFRGLSHPKRAITHKLREQ